MLLSRVLPRYRLPLCRALGRFLLHVLLDGLLLLDQIALGVYQAGCTVRLKELTVGLECCQDLCQQVGELSCFGCRIPMVDNLCDLAGEVAVPRCTYS